MMSDMEDKVFNPPPGWGLMINGVEPFLCIDCKHLRAQLAAAEQQIAQLTQQLHESRSPDGDGHDPVVPSPQDCREASPAVRRAANLDGESVVQQDYAAAGSEPADSLLAEIRDLLKWRFRDDPAPVPLAQGPQAQGWQPIETAPKDGTWILLGGESGYINRPYRAHVGRWASHPERGGWWETSEDDYFSSDGDEPTHWMKLPPVGPQAQETP